MAEEVTLKARVIFSTGDIDGGGSVKVPGPKGGSSGGSSGKKTTAWQDFVKFTLDKMHKIFRNLNNIYNEWIKPLAGILLKVIEPLGLAMAAIAFLATPEGWVTLATLVVAAIANPLKEWIDKLNLGEKIGEFIDGIKNLDFLTPMKDAWTGLVEWIKELDIVQSVIDVVSSAWNDAMEWLKGLFDPITETISTLIQNVKDFFNVFSAFKWPWEGKDFKWPWEGVNMSQILRDWLAGNADKNTGGGKSSGGGSSGGGSSAFPDIPGWQGKPDVFKKPSNTGNAGWW